MAHLMGLGAMLMAFWLFLSGHYTLFITSLGVVSIVLVTYIAHRMDVADRESIPLHLTLRTPLYLPWLAWETLKANWDVLKVCLRPNLDIDPAFGRYEGHEKTDLGRFIYANSITLTPGTITTGVYGTSMEVHSLTRAALQGTEEGEMDRRVVKLEGDA
ncbi:MAG: Na+/H+ antiporter subunit E [Gemmatimonadota bacterium]